jgi:putative nucleotidyltransferase with HDIG domain
MPYAELVSQLAHALQSAKLAVDAGGDEETIIAALLHDIGHLYATEDNVKTDDRHEEIGADLLREWGFSEKVAQLVQGHVEAKRYLAFKRPEYLAKLSPVSRHTLQLQGGPFSPDEAEAFKKDALFEEKLRLRAWDEQAKVPRREVPPLEAYRDMLLRHLNPSQ